MRGRTPAAIRAEIDALQGLRRRAIAADPVLVNRVVGSYGAALMAQGVRPMPGSICC
ncbi:MAG: hypothetical protein Q8M11_09235 [Sulfuritalea sp.]|nr:hypothetical protein [Sulfuritalea sp.]MDP1981441.1 hypothetical protein [Sulfuritalea sp.]